MTRFSCGRTLQRLIAPGVTLPLGGAVAVAMVPAIFAATALATAVIAAPACAASLPYEVAVAKTDTAARAVLARGGRESCLRGKLTQALLGLTSSCETAALRTELCALADRAAVVTPMSLAFMDDTSRQLLRLIDPATPAPAGLGTPDPEGAAAEPIP